MDNNIDSGDRSIPYHNRFCFFYRFGRNNTDK